MVDSILVDTNVLLYAYDLSDPAKQRRAMETLDRLANRRIGVLTPQILGEFFVNATRKLDPPLPFPDAYESIQNYLLAWHVLDLTGSIVLEAVRGVQTYRMPYWDAQIWASARLNQIPVVFTEDFATGAVIEDVHFVDPFVEDFDLDAWLPVQDSPAEIP